MPAWLSTILVNLGAALIKSAFNESMNNLNLAREMAETERANGVRNGVNAKKYLEAQTRADQIRAAIDMLNRNDGV